MLICLGDGGYFGIAWFSNYALKTGMEGVIISKQLSVNINGDSNQQSSWRFYLNTANYLIKHSPKQQMCAASNPVLTERKRGFRSVCGKLRAAKGFPPPGNRCNQPGITSKLPDWIVWNVQQPHTCSRLGPARIQFCAIFKEAAFRAIEWVNVWLWVNTWWCVALNPYPKLNTFNHDKNLNTNCIRSMLSNNSQHTKGADSAFAPSGKLIGT
jgi:hypothetical protein